MVIGIIILILNALAFVSQYMRYEKLGESIGTTVEPEEIDALHAARDKTRRNMIINAVCFVITLLTVLYLYNAFQASEPNNY